LQTGAEASIKVPQLTFKVQEASLDLDAFGERALTGKRYLRLKVLVSSQEPKYDSYVGPESFRAIVDGKPVGPERLSPAAEAVKAATEQEFTMAFSIPSTAANAELQVGEVGKETAKIPLSLQPAKPQTLLSLRVSSMLFLVSAPTVSPGTCSAFAANSS
jgi:hypothetical protein